MVPTRHDCGRHGTVQELHKTNGWGHVTACFCRLVLPPNEEGDWVVHSYMLYPATALVVYIGGGGGVGKVFRAAPIMHATSACVAVDKCSGRVQVLSSRAVSSDEPWLLAWGGW